jgi:cytochrome bd-type quinol oxidase subunit 2
MAEFFIFVYAMLAMFVIQSMRHNQRQQRPNPQMVTLVGWGLFSLSSTLAVLLAAVALALAIGLRMPLPEAFSAPLF